jgi:PAS domain S-box-containing protein
MKLPNDSVQDTLNYRDNRLRLAIQAGNVGLWDWDILTHEVQYSLEWKQQIGYEDHEILNDFNEWQSRIHPDDLDRVFITTNSYLKKPWPDYKLEYRIRHKDGTYRWVLGQASLEFDASGKPIHMLGSQIDITDRKVAEAALKAREERFQSLFDRAGEGIVVLSPNGKFVAANEAFARMHGYTPKEMLSINLKDLDTPESARMISERMRRILAGETLTFEVGNYHKDGHIVPIEVTASMIVIDGEPFIQSFSRDITQRKKMELDLQQAREMLYRNVLVREVHHRIKNSLQGVASLLRQQAEESPEIGAAISKAVARVRSVAVVHGLQGEVDSQVALCDMVRAISADLQTMTKLPLQVETSAHFEPVWLVEEERVPVALIVNELLFNAVKHADVTEAEQGIDINLQGDEREMCFSVYNRHGRLPLNFSFKEGTGIGNGLNLAKSLLPLKGALLDIFNDGAGVRAELRLTSPVLVRSNTVEDGALCQ